jgi:ATP-dependent DNA ligase
VSLPLSPPLLPQLALSRKALPAGPGWSYEPKWDGFRAIVFVDGDSVEIQSRNGKSLTRYFPELTFPAGRYVLDGEIVILNERGGQEFDLLGQRIHPAASRVAMLAEKTPSRFVAFDLLSLDDEVLLPLAQQERRARLERFIADNVTDATTVDLTPSTTDASAAEPWLQGAEGVIAKELDSPYRSNERKGMVKIKRVRTIDAVVAGWRPGKEEGTVGSLILGLYDERGELRGVGHTSGFSAKEKRELPSRLKPYETGERGSADPSRWDSDRELEWIALRPELVVEVTFDHVSGGRIRHGAKVQRWRTDKDPSACTVDQLDS